MTEISINLNRWRTTSLELEKSLKVCKGVWYWVTIHRDGMTRPTSRDGTGSVEYIDSDRREAIRNWCIKNCQKHWSEEGILNYGFEDEEDSVLFALTWC